MRNKYKNKKVEVDGYLFDSKKEAKRYGVLKMLLMAKKISNLRMQVRYQIIPKQGKMQAATYIADFVYVDEFGREIVEDVKGYKKGVAYQYFVLKKKLMKQVHDIDIVEI